MACLVYLTVASVIAGADMVGVQAFGGSKKSRAPLNDLIEMQAFEDLTKYVSTIVAFLIGLFVSVMVGRWWEMRKAVNNLLTTSHDVVNSIVTRLKDPADRKYLERILRYTLAAQRLCYNVAQHKEDREHLQEHVDNSLLSEEELEALVGKPSKPVIVWTWIAKVFYALYSQDRLRDVGPPVVARFDGLFAGAQRAVSDQFQYVTTQVPFPYVHLLTTLVIVNNMFIAIKCGLMVGGKIGPGQTIDMTIFVIELLHVTLVPFTYHAFLTMGFELANPFGSDCADFPGYTYTIYAREENLACLDSYQCPPSTVTDGLEPKEKV